MTKISKSSSATGGCCRVDLNCYVFLRLGVSEGDTDKKRTKHIAKHFHFVKEKRAAGLVVLKYLATALQVADMFTKQIFPKHFERLRRVMMGHENFDDMCERYQDAKAAGDDVDDPKLYTVKPVRPQNG